MTRNEKQSNPRINTTPSSSSPKKGSTESVKDLSHLTWWSRLLKLATVLNAKLAACLIFDPSSHIIDPVESPSPQEVLSLSLARHAMWAYMTPPDDIYPLSESFSAVRTFVQPVVVSSQKPGSARSKQLLPLNASMSVTSINSNNIGIKILNKCAILRDRDRKSVV